jgi:thiol-disulfide isomerase/thioredoxin
MSRYARVACAFAAAVVAWFCLSGWTIEQSWTGVTAWPGAKAAAAADAKADLNPADIKVTVVDKAGLAKAIAAHKGKVVLVDYWATWCAPCVKQFPHTVELWRKNRDRGFAVIALSFDEPDEIEDVQKFLAGKGAGFDNLISKVGAAESSAEEFDYDGALPNYAIYDRAGKLVKRISPSDPTIPFRPEMIDEAVEEQLAVKAAK